jgi:hypothetical protein
MGFEIRCDEAAFLNSAAGLTAQRPSFELRQKRMVEWGIKETAGPQALADERGMVWAG